MIVLFAMVLLLAFALINWRKVTELMVGAWSIMFALPEREARGLRWLVPAFLALMLGAAIVMLVVLVISDTDR